MRAIDPFKIVSAGDMSADITTPSIDIRQSKSCAFQFVWSAGSSPAGTFTVEFSANGSDWTTSSLVLTAISGNTGSQAADMVETAFPFVRAKYTRASGSGTLNAYFCAKEN